MLFLPEEREWLAKLLGWGLVDTYRAKTLMFLIATHGLTTVRKASMITVAYVSIYYWPPINSLSVVLQRVLITKSAGWKSHQTTHLYGLNLTSQSKLSYLS